MPTRALFRLELGGVVYCVPPLNMRRFLAAFNAGLFLHLREFYPVPPIGEPQAEAVERLSKMEHGLTTPLAVAIVPGLLPAIWREHGSGAALVDLLVFLAAAHDWERFFSVHHAELPPAGDIGVTAEEIGAMPLDDFVAFVESTLAGKLLPGGAAPC
jgi:hypothetical protein